MAMTDHDLAQRNKSALLDEALETGGTGDGYDDDGREKRTGTWVTASAHIITAVIGSGVLSLAWATAQLGWLVGPAVLLAFSIITWFCSSLLADCYRSHGKRNYTYMGVVRSNLGGMKFKLCGLAQYVNLVGVTIGYTITAAISLAAIKRSNCFHKNGHGAACEASHMTYMIFYGCVQLVLSQMPNFHKLWWLSIVAALMSFAYSFIGLGLSVAKIAEGTSGVRTTLTGVTVGVDVSGREKLWRTFQAIGDMAFAYSYSTVLVEIQDTLRSQPPEIKEMKKASLAGVSTTTVFYMLCGVLGYAAFGNDAPGNFLTGFGFYEPFWLVDIGNLCIAIHLIGAYQVCCQPVFQFIEGYARSVWPDSAFITGEHGVNIPLVGVYSLNFFRLSWRSLYVVVTIVVAMIFPFFNDFLGLIGSFAFWPLTVYFPTEMYMVKTNTPRFSMTWVALKSLSTFCLLVSIAAACGSAQGLVQSVRGYKPFSGV